MPNYKYICSNKECNHYMEIWKSIKLYDKEEFCEVCNSLLERDYNDLVCGYTNNKDFFGRSTDRKRDGS